METDLIVERRRRQVLLVWRLAYSRHRVHARVGDVLEIDGDVPLPHAD